jgi:hypothetical protein
MRSESKNPMFVTYAGIGKYLRFGLRVEESRVYAL